MRTIKELHTLYLYNGKPVMVNRGVHIGYGSAEERE